LGAPLRRKARHRLPAEDPRVALSEISASRAEGFPVRLSPPRERCDLARAPARRADLVPRVDRRPEAPPARLSRFVRWQAAAGVGSAGRGVEAARRQSLP